MEQQPLVSVIINCYNGEKYLREAIDSVIAQTYTNWELIFWDNQSTDSTAEIVKSYKDERIRYFYAPEHTPLGEARNLAMKEAKGEYIGFLDADDIWLVSKLESEIKILELGDYGLIYTSYKSFGLSETLYSGIAGERSLNSLLTNYDIAMSSAIFKKSVVDAFNLKINNCFNLVEDLDFFISLSLHTNVYHVKDVLVLYRENYSSLTYKYRNWHEEYELFINKLENLLSPQQKISCKEGLEVLQKKYLVSFYADAINDGRRIEALRYVFYLPHFKSILLGLIRICIGNKMYKYLKTLK